MAKKLTDNFVAFNCARIFLIKSWKNRTDETQRCGIKLTQHVYTADEFRRTFVDSRFFTTLRGIIRSNMENNCSDSSWLKDKS